MPDIPATTYRQLYREHHGWLKDWLRRRLGCGEVAADLAQDTFVRVIQRRQKPEVIRRPRAFLATIAHGIVVNHWRRQDIERAYLKALASQPEPAAVSPEEQHLILETLHEIDAALSRLPDKVCRAFLMAQLDGLTYHRIGAELGVSERMVKKYMAHAMLTCLSLAD